MSYVTPAMKDALKNHVLEEQPAGGKFRAFYMKEPGQGRMMSTLFVFTPEGIVIMGDLCPGGPNNQGSISNYGYGIEWFSKKLSEGYLCGKFLREEWQAEAALEWVLDHIEEIQRGEHDGEFDDAAKQGKADIDGARKTEIEKFREIERDLGGGEMDATRFYDALISIGHSIDDDLHGMDYPINTAGWLCALQQRFSELFVAQEMRVKANG